MSITNTIKLTIDEKSYGYAKIYSSLLADEFQRKRAYASILALYSFLNILEKTPYEIQKAMTLFRNPLINEQYEIADLYVNDWHLDVRIVTGGDAVLIPKIHYDADIVPDFYIVIKVDSELKNAELIGIADTSNMEKEAFDYHYYSVGFDSLISYDDFLKKIQQKKVVNFKNEDHELFRESYLGLMDSEIDKQTKNKILKHLFECDECRTEFCCFTGFEMVSCNSSKYPELLDDHTLSIIGSQSVDDKKYEGKEETIYIDDNSEEEETGEETVSDILDELFNIEEDFIEDTDSVTEKSIDSYVASPNTKEDNEIQVIEDISTENLNMDKQNDDLEIIDDYSSVDTPQGITLNNDEMEVIQDDIYSELSLKSDIEVIGANTTDELDEKEDMVILDSSEDADLITEDTGNLQLDKEDNIQKVIVDYDENNKPVYSYITPVNQNEAENITSEIEPIDDDILSATDDIEYEVDSYGEGEQTEDLADEKIYSENETIDDTSQDNDFAESKDEFVVDIDDNNSQLINEENDIDVSDTNEDNKTEKILSYDDEELTGTDETLQKYEEYKDDASEDVEEYEEYKDDDSEDDGEYEEYKDDDSEESQEYEDYNDDDQEYDDDEEVEIPEEKISKGSSKVALLVLSIVVLISFIGGGAFFLLKNKSNTEVVASDTQNDSNVIEIQNQQQTNDMFEQPIETGNYEQGTNTVNADNITSQPPVENPMTDSMPTTGTIAVPPLTESDLIKPTERQSHGDVNKAIANAFSQSGSGVSFRGLNWFCTSELFSDRTFKNYLQNLDNTLKQNLKNNILNATQTPPQDTVAAKFAVDNNGNLQKVIISESSGLEEIENIVLQSIKESFEGEKIMILNDSALKSDMYYLKVVIKL